MQRQRFAALFSFIAVLVQAAPGPAAAAATGFSSQCSGIILNTNWLVADCPDNAGKLVSSGVYLPLHVTNTEGKLKYLADNSKWETNGAYQESCSDCLLLNGGATLQCYCTGTFANEDGNSTLNLEEYIANYNGHLLSSLEGNPTVPSDASIAVPSDVVLSLSAYEGPYYCPSDTGATLNFAGPETCWYLNLAVDPIVWTELRAISNPGWSVSVYNVSTCTGTPVVTFDSVNECITVGQNGGAYFSLTPLWNYD